MQEVITSREMVEYSVINLLNGVKSIKGANGTYSTILSQFIRPDYRKEKPERTELTRNIADTLYCAVLNQLHEAGDTNTLRLKIMLFIYVISGVDLTFLCRRDDLPQYEAEFLKLIRAVFYAFIGKESVSKIDLKQLVYQHVYGRFWEFEPIPVQIREADYWNYNLAQIYYYTAEAQLIGASPQEVMERFGNFFDFPEEMTISKYQQSVSKDAQASMQRLEESVTLLIDLMKANTPEAILKKYPEQLKDINLNRQKRISWKVDILEKKQGMFRFSNMLRNIFSELTFSEHYHPYYAKINSLYSHMEKQCDKKSKKQSAANQELIEHDTFQKAIRSLFSVKECLRLQVRINTELCTFGNINNLPENCPVLDAQGYVDTMLQFPFYGVSSKAGMREYDVNMKNGKSKNSKAHCFPNTCREKTEIKKHSLTH